MECGKPTSFLTPFWTINSFCFLSQKEHSILHSWVRFSGFQNYSFTSGMNPSLLLCPSWIARNCGSEIVIIRWRIDNRYSKQSGQNFISFFTVRVYWGYAMCRWNDQVRGGGEGPKSRDGKKWFCCQGCIFFSPHSPYQMIFLSHIAPLTTYVGHYNARYHHLLPVHDNNNPTKSF